MQREVAMAPEAKKTESVDTNRGEIVMYQADDGQTALDVRLKDESVWLSQAQMITLFQRDQSVISRHVHNVFSEGELPRQGNMQKMHIALSDKPVVFFSLDVIISVGYRIKSKRGTQFRIWATSVLKEHIIRGYTLNQHRLAEKGLGEARQVLALLAKTLEDHDLVKDEGRAVLDIVSRYARTWQLLLQYDEESLPVLEGKHGTCSGLELGEVRSAIAALKNDLWGRGEATDLFGQERGHGLAGIIGAVWQSFAGQDLYPSVEDKAAHLLYFVIKDHPFSDGNKRIGSFLFLYFLKINGLLTAIDFDSKALVALALLIAASDPGQKELLIRLVVNLLAAETEAVGNPHRRLAE